MTFDTQKIGGGQPALDGITVLEVGSFIAAPFAATQLADMGARVIKVEGPDGDATRAAGPFIDGESSPFLRLNRNKESVLLNLKDDNDRDAFLTIASQADVLIENLRPGAMDRLGLSYEILQALNPGLIYASASGWGKDGPLSSLAGLDIMAQARSGLMSITGEPGGNPVKVGVPVCDVVTALYITIGILAALQERNRSGVGQSIDVSLFESAVSLAIWEAGSYLGAGTLPKANGNAHQSIAPYQAFRTADGWVTIGAATQKLWLSLTSVLDLDELAHHSDFALNEDRLTNRDTLIPLIEAETLQHSTEGILAKLNAAGIPSAPINTYDQVFNDEHLNARGFFWDAPHRDNTIVRQVGSPIRLSRSGSVRSHAAPSLGKNTAAILKEFEATAPDSSDFDTTITSGATAGFRTR